MLSTLILGGLAGWAAPHAEPHVRDALQGAMPPDAPLTDTELRHLSFAACLLAAAVLGHVFGNGSAIALCVGAALGVFAPRAIRRYRHRQVSDNDEE